ncbi:MAG: PAS domain S-box protein [Deltaproteobacteria bacterium]|nr:PAS domain S-box protein [Deltaproteobacteria bacterium]MBW1911131.1 PAS domain S-box protein [Deltaproteobacteria bacterium]MBW2034074.1 PAS domain S-box protein [Deltaproteobacteria bacterium]
MAAKPSYEELEQRIKELEEQSFERKQAEEKAKHEKKRLESLVKYSSLAIVTLDARHNIVSCNRDFEELFSFKESEIVGKNLDKVIAKEKYIKEAISYTKKTLTGQTIHGSGKRNRKDGTLIDVEFHGVPVVVDGKVVGAFGIYQDITERKRAEAALQESEERYRNLFNNISDFIYTHDFEGRFLTVNRAASQTLGYKPEELLGRPISDFMLPEYRATFYAEYLTGIKNKGSLDGVSKYLAKDGTEHYIEYRNVLVEQEGQEPFVYGSGREITERILSQREVHKLERQFHHSQKMEAIGTLAGGIAHDFNNLLMGILGNASLVLLDIDSSHPYYEKLKNIQQHVQSGADLTKQLLGFARGGKYEVRPTDLNEIIKKSSEMFGRTKKEVVIHPKYQKNIWTVEIDRGQIDQVLLNLYVNAWQAMPEGGNLYIQTKNITLDKNYVKPYKSKPGRYVRISVTDTGVGMDESTRQKIFDPFFTTREMGRGTGLGLASVYGIIKNHDGIINVDSEEGEGTTFNIYLPATEKETIQKEHLPEEVLKGTETLLLVDDEDMIIDACEQLLEEMGYKVLIAKGGKDAIKVYKKNKDEIDMVILDMIMPDMGGGETYDKLKEINPKIKVLLASGYSIDGQASEILGRGCNGFIQKPFQMENLSHKIKEVLEKK